MCVGGGGTHSGIVGYRSCGPRFGNRGLLQTLKVWGGGLSW